VSTNHEHPGLSQEQVEEQVRKAVEDGRDIAREVERITSEALSLGRLEMERMKTVIEGVAKGASEGAGDSPAPGREAVSEALDGLQNAMLQSFESAKLAVEESTSKMSEYSETELKQRLAELRDMEKTLLDTLSATAKSGAHTGTEILEDLVKHARRSGTRLGSEVETSMRSLAKSLPDALRETAVAGFGAARETSARAAEAASGLFKGIAETLRDNDAHEGKDNSGDQ